MEKGSKIIKNHWYIKGFCYWEKQLSKDENGTVWINVGWHLPLSVSHGDSLKKILAVSAYTYGHKFN